MNKEIQYITSLLKKTYDGDPWFGSSIKKIVAEVDAKTALQKPNQQHSILELIYHMLTWREFIISRLQPGNDKTVQYFEKNDWRELDHNDLSLWEKGLQLLENTQQLLTVLLGNLTDDILSKQVTDREYNYRFLFHGVIQHDIYHLGQIAYVKKLLQ
jgi:uncharacterized damage-inducible protein DinB